MVITQWTTKRLSEDGNDVRVEWADNDRFLSVYEDDCETQRIVLGLGTTRERADTAARTFLQRVEALGTSNLLADLDAAIDRVHESQLDALYATEGGEL